MTIFNLEVTNLNGFIEFNKIYTLNKCSIPTLGIDDIVGINIRRIYPTSTLNLERMRFGTLDDLTVNVKFNKSGYFVDSGRDNFLFRCFTCNVVNTGNRISEKVDRQADSKWLTHFERLSR